MRKWEMIAWSTKQNAAEKPEWKSIWSPAKEEVARFAQEEEGIGVVEIILILVVLVGLIVIFKKQLTTLVNNAFKGIAGKAGSL